MALTATEEALLRDLLAKQAPLIALANNEATITAKLSSTKATIDDLTAATTVADADLMIVRQGGVDKKLPVSVSLASPALTGAPTAPTAAAGTNTTQIATTAFVQAEKPADASETVAGKIEIATSAEAQAGTDAARAITPAGLRSGLNATGSAPVYACRAWVNFNGTGTVAIRASGNVSSVTDTWVGEYTINFMTAMPDANYSTVATSTPTSNGTNWSTGSLAISGVYSTTGVGVCHLVTASGGGGSQDTTIFNVAVFR